MGDPRSPVTVWNRREPEAPTRRHEIRQHLLAVEKLHQLALVEARMAFEPIHPREGLLVEVVELARGARGASFAERRESSVVEHPVAWLRRVRPNQPRPSKEVVVGLAAEQRSVNKDRGGHLLPLSVLHAAAGAAATGAGVGSLCFQADEPPRLARRWWRAVLNSSPIIPRRRRKTRKS